MTHGGSGGHGLRLVWAGLVGQLGSWHEIHVCGGCGTADFGVGHL